MASSLTINFSAGAAGLVSTVNQQVAAERAQKSQTPDQTQLAKASQIAAEKAASGAKKRTERDGFQIPTRVEHTPVTYKKKKKPGNNASLEEAESESVEEKDAKSGDHPPLDVEA